MIRLAERAYEEAAGFARDPKAVIVFPLGAIEEHSPHLPLLVDWLGAEELARVIAPYLRRAGWRPVLVPSMPYGTSPLAEDWSGTVSLSTGTLRRVVGEVIRGLARHGFRRFVLTNYQADPGHLRAMALIKHSAERRGRVQVLFAGFAPGHSNTAMVNSRITALLRSPQPEREWHSGELETAMVLAVRPGLVRRAIGRRLPPAWVDVKRARAVGPTTFRRMNPKGRGYFGWPAAARPETDRAAPKLRARLISQDLISGLQAWRPARRADPNARR
jgi:creatinine amidohydrolase